MEPRVQKYLREAYRKHALLTTKPTQKGLNKIDVFHKFCGAHLIRNKPVQMDFLLNIDDPSAVEENKQWSLTECSLLFLNVMNTEREGHISVHLHLPLLNTFGDGWFKVESSASVSKENQNLMALGELLRMACLQGSSNNVEWIKERSKAISFAIENFLIPKFERELQKDLHVSAFQHGVNQAGQNPKSLAMEGRHCPP